MLKLKIKIEGMSKKDIEESLEEIKKHLEDGYEGGFDEDEKKKYSFDLEGEEYLK